MLNASVLNEELNKILSEVGYVDVDEEISSRRINKQTLEYDIRCQISIT